MQDLDKEGDRDEPRLLLPKDELLGPLQGLPPVDFAFAYGSGVFHQPSSSSASERMVDYILGVPCPSSWHSKNIEMNPEHYSSWLATFGGKAVSGAANIVGVGVHFNPFVPWKNKTIKYGVIGIPELREDIHTWKRLYIAGRLQKPVCILVDESGITTENEANLEAALSTARLLLPSKFSEDQLYETICGLSYMGDIRLLFAEDKNKVPKIVKGSFSDFRSLYRRAITGAGDGLKTCSAGSSSSIFSQELGPETVRALTTRLPATFMHKLAAKAGAEASVQAVADVLIKEGPDRGKLVRRTLAGIVRTSSLRQAFAGLLAAGGVNAFRYASSKISKAWQSTRGK